VNQIPARLKININDISVHRTLISYEGLSVSNTSAYMTRYLTYTIVYTVYNCGFGIPLLTHSASNEDLVIVQRTVAATSGVTGEFKISAPHRLARGSQTVHSFPYNVSATILKMWLENTFDFGDVAVTIMSSTCHSTTYNIQWLGKVLDYEPLIVDGSGLIQEAGNVTSIAVQTITNGGVFLRPFRGDMLRLPKKNPQVNL